MRKFWRTTVLAALGLIAPLAAFGAKPSAGDALQLLPVQSTVDFDRPTAEEAAKCTVEIESVGGITGWVVKGESGQVLRRFLDSNGDGKVDQWCYFKHGIEVYRDIDANFNNKADQYRWLGTSGIRWGLDADEDSRIDSWKQISAEEVTAEVVAALAEQDSRRFARLVLSEKELVSLGLGEARTEQLRTKVQDASTQFSDLMKKQRVVTPKSAWIHFGASQPGIVPAGVDGATQDLVVYDNVTAVVETAGKHSTLVIGTLVKVGDAWRLIDVPQNLAADATAQASVGYFFQASMSRRPETEGPADASTVSAEMQRLITDLEKLDKQLVESRSRTEVAKLNSDRADILDKLVTSAKSEEDRGLWIRQYAETVAAAVQSAAFPEGVARLTSLRQMVAKMPESTDLVAYVKFREMSALYNLELSKKDVDFEKVNATWMTSLEEFVKEYSKSPDAAEAMLQLAIGSEFSGKEEKAIEWFGKIVSEFPSTDLAKKAAGAKRRLESVGKTITLSGKTVDGRAVDISSLSGKVVLVHYWATWCEPCKQDLDLIKDLQAKFGKQGFTPVGVNLDSDARDLGAYLRTKTLPWPQLFEPGGLEGRLANEMGILTLPTMILVDREGKVVNRNINAGELDTELRKLLR
ncbi:Redoxin domain protein [Pirellula staleyi DSM 6068]|uniref:Redoxin domain protein n=1 Tax=Pirellula staleyi (strain ATCC 27377 / DSM 6068 / ICPB 4128) TaxID=530564 RepID=D2R5R1_PIRSD|nr:redoxin domain-containing protein [Pirellula staleyi]ADB17243.1 Redoxin domain protein [Pirellula staleyi DSM 6068]